MKLPMDITTHSHGALDTLHIRLGLQNLLGLNFSGREKKKGKEQKRKETRKRKRKRKGKKRKKRERKRRRKKEEKKGMSA